jgi:hypothetical protein
MMLGIFTLWEVDLLENFIDKMFNLTQRSLQILAPQNIAHYPMCAYMSTVDQSHPGHPRKPPTICQCKAVLLRDV